jgi:tetratricopeptide (TPR) repeat protein
LAEYTATERVRAAVDPANEKLLARIRVGWSWCYVRMGRAAEADKALQDVLSARYTPQRLGPVLWASIRINDATALTALQRYFDAEKSLTAALQELRQTSGNDNVFVANAENQLGEVYTRSEKWADAVSSYKEAYRIYALRTGAEARNTLITLTNLGIVEYQTGRAAEAAKILAPLHVKFVQATGEEGPLTQSVDFYLASAQRDLGNYNEASALIAHLNAARLDEAEPRGDWATRLAALQRSIARTPQ